MLQQVYQVTAGGLLHDIGKVIYRAQSLDSRSHPQSGYAAAKEIIDQSEILQCIRYHHKKDLASAQLADNALAFLVYLADNIASGADRRSNEEEEQRAGFDKTLPLESIFNLLNQNTQHYSYVQGDLNAGIRCPQEQVVPYTATKYNALYQDLSDGLKQIVYTPEYSNSLLALLESYLTYVPSSTNRQEVADISLYDHSKMTAAVAACMYLYLAEQGRSNFRQELLVQEKQFMDEEAFLMFSCDLSGIQSFIYTTSGDGALKALRARSLYLEILLEHLADEILQVLGLSRANLIYTGGGHAYLLLANTETTKRTLEQLTQKINQWFLGQFDNDLYLATAWQPCSANGLMNQAREKDAYQKIFQNVSRQLGAKKISRYSADELRMLNQSGGAEERRECKECKRSVALQQEDICSFCQNIKNISNEMIKEDSYFAVVREPFPNHGALPLPDFTDSDVYLQILDEATVRTMLPQNKIVRFYSKNKMVTGKTLATNIWMGDYHVRDARLVASFESLANASKGVKRIGVLRADIDNLGQAFVSGFIRKQAENPAKYVTISRTATLSRNLSMFFKYYLNDVLANPAKLPIQPFSLDGSEKTAARNVMIIYSGGDDLFLVGAWNEIIECAVDIHHLFALYGQGTLTLSAGVGVFPHSYPLIRMAEESGSLEATAKQLDADKNAIALFGNDQVEHCYHWQQFEKEIVGEKLRFLQKHLGTKQEQEDTSTAFLYQLLTLLRHADKKINLARFAYTLARKAERIVDNVADNTEEQRAAKQAMQREFCDKMYAWYLDETQRKQLMTAIYLYVYLYRE